MGRNVRITAAIFVVLAGWLTPRICAAQCGPPPRNPSQCVVWTCNAADAAWDSEPRPAGFACDDHNACTANDMCDGVGHCLGTLSCPPGVPGPISGPASSSNGSYVLTWTAASGVIDHYVLYENGAGFFNTTGLSASLAGRGDGTYRYNVQACNSAGCGGLTADYFVSVLLPPGVPGPIGVPSESGPSYTVSWTPGSGRNDRYDLDESPDQATWTTTSVTGTSKSYSGHAYGTYWYRVRGCNTSGCGGCCARQLMSI